jgi:hypothetical protein
MCYLYVNYISSQMLGDTYTCMPFFKEDYILFTFLEW